MSRAALGAIGAAAAGALILAYLLIAPGNAASGYREDAEPAQERVADAMSEVFASFNGRGVFGSSSGGEATEAAARRQVEAFRQELASIEKSIDTAREAISAAEPAATEVNAPPLVGGFGPVQDAKDVAERERAYLSDASAYLDEYEAVVATNREGIAIDEEAFEAVDALSGIGAETSPGEVESAVASTTDRLEAARAGLRKVDPPAALEDLHGNALRTADVYVEAFRRFQEAFATGDLATLESTQAEFDEETSRLEREGKRLQQGLLRDSSLSKSIQRLKDEAAAIADELAQL